MILYGSSAAKMVHRNFSITNGYTETIRAEIHYREGIKEAPIIVICHGFKGFKNWAFFPVLAESLAYAGYVTLTFNFSRNGIGADLNNFTELNLFENNTYSHELKDLKCVIDAIVTGQIGRVLIDPEQIGLVGHSRGGGISILYSQKDPRIKALVTWSAIATVDRFSEEQKKEFEENGFIEIENKRTLQIMRVGKELLNDINKNKSSLDICSAASALTIPTLIIHGESDETVPVSEAYELYDHLGTTEKELIIIEGGSHTFGAQHPMTSMTASLENAFDLTENWFDRYLK
jgi:dienelactone hydrolase